MNNPNTKENYEIRQDALNALKGNWTTIILTILAFSVVTFILEFTAVIPFIGFLIAIAVSGALSLGIKFIFIKLSRYETFTIGNIFYGFNDFWRAFLSTVLISIFTFLWSLLFIIPGIIVAISYSMTYYIMIDNPNLTSSQCINKSKRLMYGNKWRYFCLNLSFIGWAILCIFTFGLGYLWLSPYIATSKACFYNSLINKDKTKEKFNFDI